ncbi:uncharacterized protein LOC110882490 [Helianthus annuus]|uniref:uncharacterized protein LOC110882490 n=1 Tax=Helianthus annuus TaxID=4232 RepID=UPI000B8F0809|nr:uncharacterized protein LOC110882490 [Helianthus annuus]
MVRFGHSAQKSNQVYRRSWSDDYYTSNQCYDLSVWSEREEWYDNRVCYSCEEIGHIVVNCLRKKFVSRRCYNCQIKGHVARDCPVRSKRESLDKPHKKEKKKVDKAGEKPKERKRKLPQGHKDKFRNKRKKVREYLDKILSSDTAVDSDECSDESFCSPKSDQSTKMKTERSDQSSKTNSSDTNLRTEDRTVEMKVIHQIVMKPKQIWRTKVSDEVSTPVEISKLFNDKRDCEWTAITKIDEFGQPKSILDWVPIQN